MAELRRFGRCGQIDPHFWSHRISRLHRQVLARHEQPKWSSFRISLAGCFGGGLQSMRERASPRSLLSHSGALAGSASDRKSRLASPMLVTHSKLVARPPPHAKIPPLRYAPAGNVPIHEGDVSQGGREKRFEASCLRHAVRVRSSQREHEQGESHIAHRD